jgi:hypothetical protein
VLAPTIDKQPRLVVLIEMPADIEDDVMLVGDPALALF